MVCLECNLAELRDCNLVLPSLLSWVISKDFLFAWCRFCKEEYGRLCCTFLSLFSFLSVSWSPQESASYVFGANLAGFLSLRSYGKKITVKAKLSCPLSGSGVQVEWYLLFLSEDAYHELTTLGDEVIPMSPNLLGLRFSPEKPCTLHLCSGWKML